MTNTTQRELEVLLTLQDQMTKELRRVGAELGGFERKAKTSGGKVRETFGKIRTAVTRVKDAIKGLLNPLTLIGGAIGVGAVINLARGLSQAAAAAEELDSKFRALTADRADSLSAWIDQVAESTNRGRQQIKGMVADTIPFLERMLGSRDAAIETSKALSQLAIDVGSFRNVDAEDTLQRFRSALVGSAEALDVFGARIADGDLKAEAFRLGITDTERELTNNEKSLTRLGVLFGRFGSDVGDAAKTADSFTNRMIGLRETVRDLQVEFGTRLNDAIMQGLDAAGGVEAVREITTVFFASVVELARAGITLGAQLATGVRAAFDELGGVDGIVEQIQLRGEQLAAQLALVGLGIRTGVAEFGGYIRELVELMQSIGVLSGPNPAADRSLAENQARASELRELNRQANRELREMREQQGIGSKHITDQEQYVEALRAEYEALQPIILTQKERAAIEADLAALREQIVPLSEIGASGAGVGAEAADLQDQALTTLEQIDQLLARLFSPEAARERREQLGETAKQLSELEQQAGAFAERQVANLADGFLSVANGARSAGEAVRGFFRVFIADLLRAQAISAFRVLFGGAFSGIFSGVNAGVFSSAVPVADTVDAADQGGASGGLLSGGGKIKGYASGGSIAATDTVPAMLTPGEFIMSRGAVNRLGADNLAAMNAGKAPASSSQNVNVSFNVSAVDARSVTDLLAEDGKNLARVIGYAFARSRDLQAIVRGQA